MKIEKLDEDNLIVFLNKLYLKKHKFNLKNKLDSYFKEIFKILKDYYNISIVGYYDIKIYHDNIYGYVLKIKKENLDFYNYYENHIDMKITISNYNKFIFKVNNRALLNDKLFKYCYVSKYKNLIYILPKKTINQVLLGNLLENTDIIYGKESYEIIEYGKPINSNYIFV